MRKTGNDKDNRITGSNGDDVIRGKGGDDFLVAKKGEDILFGGAGDDVLVGGPGVDALKGGKGADVYSLNNLSQIDTIIGFKPGVDRIFIETGTGHAIPAEDVFGSTLTYQGNTISYDSQPIAIIKAALPLTADDFILG